jgi:hypothetical protein
MELFHSLSTSKSSSIDFGLEDLQIFPTFTLEALIWGSLNIDCM